MADSKQHDNKCLICDGDGFCMKKIATGFVLVCKDCFSDLEPLLDRLRKRLCQE